MKWGCRRVAERKSVLITGGTRGIGRACVERFARAGWQVAFLYHARTDAVESLTAAMRAEGFPVRSAACDLADAGETERAVQELLSVQGIPDALVNNAGISCFGLFQDMGEEDWERILSVNLRAAARVSRLVLPGMISRKSGAIVNVASMWGEVGASCETVYSAAKAGLIGLTRALAKEVGPSGIRVNAVSPGVIETDMNAVLSPETLETLAEETPLGRMGRPEEVAAAVWFLAGEEASFITGQVLGVNGGFVI